MSDLARFGVSLEADMLAAFDAYCKNHSYASRSEAIRDLIRNALAVEQCKSEDACAGALSIIYDHHKHDLARRVMAIQHDYHESIVASLHVHLNHDACLETLILRGDVKRVRKLAEALSACRGVRYGSFCPLPLGDFYS